ncbi:MAG: hypothetical protein IJZ68_08260 [Bacteroidaceae bacterium]|nr:hypothetical protein [Bacteroidaceae bacterium]
MLIAAIEQMHNNTMFGWLAVATLCLGLILAIGHLGHSIGAAYDKMDKTRIHTTYYKILCFVVCGCAPAIIKTYLILTGG